MVFPQKLRRLICCRQRGIDQLRFASGMPVLEVRQPPCPRLQVRPLAALRMVEAFGTHLDSGQGFDCLGHL